MCVSVNVESELLCSQLTEQQNKLVLGRASPVLGQNELVTQ